MGNTYVRNGTPIGSVSRCTTCSYAHIVEGYRESEVVSLCTYDRGIMISFKVKSCSNYLDRTRPSWEDMEKLALPVTAGSLKPVGFLFPQKAEANDD